ncbi:MAG: transcriptional repressor [Syntrophaceae bacterium]|nr:transcriptional repressor [Syntrophaceae bacterium]
MRPIRRNSKQRSRIYNLIKDSLEHPTAQWIYNQIRKEFSKVSMGNVYRNINILVEDGLIKSRDFGDGIVHFDAVTNLHYHFICNECNRITDSSLPIQDEITKMAQKETKNTITSHTIQFFGICEKCKKG